LTIVMTSLLKDLLGIPKLHN